MFMNEPRDILLLDWGIGGLSVYRELKKLRPDLGCVYVSDSGATPYGKMEAEALADRLVKLIGAAAKRFSLREVIIACNAASTALGEVGARLPELRISGMIEAGVEAVRAEGSSRAGVIGGIRTVESGVYQAALGKLGIAVEARAAQPLSALIEARELKGPKLEATLKPILEPLLNIPVLLLACTHYPAVAAEIQKLLPGTKLLDPAPFALAAALDLPAGGGGETLFFTTGTCADSDRSARMAFGVDTDFKPAEWL